MTKIPFLLTLLVALLVCLLPIAPAQAQAPRTFVSAAGSDSNPCSFAAPCRHFQAAVNATSAGGEVDALDPAGYGPIFITKSITIEGQGWSYIAPPFGGDGISINAPGDRVAIHGVSINGVGITPAFGIVFNSGSSLKVQDCVLQNFSGTGILFQPNGSSKISVANTRVSDSNFGIAISPTGTGTTNGVLNHVDIENNIQDGITVSTSSQGLNVTITDSVSAQNGGDGVKMAANLSTVYVRDSSIVNNGNNGVEATSSNNTGAIFLTRSTITGNGSPYPPGTPHLFSYGDNSIGQNETGGDINPPPPVPLQ
jgi:hypothetical protein